MVSTRNQQLTITAIPFRSSNLAIPPSPFSPRLPITPPASPPPTRAGHESPIVPAPTGQTDVPPTVPPPASPLDWRWQCHVCQLSYSLGTTRRCLEDGHRVCSEMSAVLKPGNSLRDDDGIRALRRRRTCVSLFDYDAWKAWGEWRREEEAFRKIVRELIIDDPEEAAGDAGGVADRERQDLSAPRKKVAGVANKKDCWRNCDYPSECRWGMRLQLQDLTARGWAASLNSESGSGPPQVFEDMDIPQQTYESAGGYSVDGGIYRSKEAFWSIILMGIGRRKSNRPSVACPAAGAVG